MHMSISFSLDITVIASSGQIFETVQNYCYLLTLGDVRLYVICTSMTGILRPSSWVNFL